MTDTKALALELAKIGWYVFPCGADKKPLCKWKELATCDPDAIEAMNWPGLVGIYCAKSGFFAIDFDVRGSVNGLETWTRWQNHYGKVAAGPVQQTPSGGAHALFKLPKNLPVPNKARLFPGVDLRSEGYVCSGPGYTWTTPPGTPIPDAPGWFLDFLDPDLFKDDPAEESQKLVNTPQGSIDFWLEKYLPLATIGRRNETGFNLACQVRDAGYSQAEAEALPYPERCPRGQDVYDRAEWLASVKSAYERTPRDPAKKQGALNDSNALERTPMTGDELADYFAGIPEPEAPPESPQDTPGQEQQLEPDQNTTEKNGDGWVDPWQDAWQTLADAFTPRPPTEWAVDSLIKLPSLIAWYGNPGDFKTFLLQYMFLCIAAGLPCFPEAPWKSGGRVFAVNNPYPVIWLDFDNGVDATQERFEALARALGIDPSLPNLHYVSMPSPWLVLGDPKSAGHLIRQIGKFEARVMGIENLGTTKGGARENTDEMIPVISNLRQVVNTTRSGIQFVHHETKSGALTARRGDSLRGHSSIEAAVDLALLVEREPGSDIVTVQSTKTRGVTVDPFSAAFTYTHKPGTSELETAMFYALPCENKRSPKAIEAAIKEALADNPMLKTALAKQVQAATEGIGINRIRDYIDRMIATEAIVTTPGGKTTGTLCTLR